jgi:hypothetical protein
MKKKLLDKLIVTTKTKFIPKFSFHNKEELYSENLISKTSA